MIRVNRFGANVRVHRDGLTDIMTIANAARLLAGLEVALAAALREAGRGKCLKCGKLSSRQNMPLPPWHSSELHCHKCGGILAPVDAGRQP